MLGVDDLVGSILKARDDEALADRDGVVDGEDLDGGVLGVAGAEDHGGGADLAELGLLEIGETDHLHAGELLERDEVPEAGHDLAGRLLAEVDLFNVHGVGVGVHLGLDDLADEDIQPTKGSLVVLGRSEHGLLGRRRGFGGALATAATSVGWLGGSGLRGRGRGRCRGLGGRRGGRRRGRRSRGLSGRC